MYEATEEIDYLVSATGALEGVFDRLPAGELGYIWSRMQDNPDFQGSLRVISEGLDDVSLYVSASSYFYDHQCSMRI